jgi:hypothetical protein
MNAIINRVQRLASPYYARKDELIGLLQAAKKIRVFLEYYPIKERTYGGIFTVYIRRDSKESWASLNHVRPLPSNNPGRRACQVLPHPDPKADRFAHCLEHRAESEGADHPLQSGNSRTIARCVAMGIDPLLGKRLKDRLPDH